MAAAGSNSCAKSSCGEAELPLPLVAQLKASSNSICRLIFCFLPLPRLFPWLLSPNVVFLAHFGFYQLFLLLSFWPKKGFAGNTPPCPSSPQQSAGFSPHRSGKWHWDRFTGCPEHWFAVTGCWCDGAALSPSLQPHSHASPSPLQGKTLVIFFFFFFYTTQLLSLALGVARPGRGSVCRSRYF